MVNADRQERADVYIESGKIKLVAPNLKVLLSLPFFDHTFGDADSDNEIDTSRLLLCC